MLLVAVLSALAAFAQPLPMSTPDKEGLSAERLKRMHAALESATRNGKKAGVVSMIVRNGKIADWKVYGSKDLESKQPMEKDTMFRIWSMTKPLTSVAAMILFEEGKLRLEDPVKNYVPEFAELRVFEAGTADSPRLVPAARPMTIKHLLTHSSGLSYGFQNHAVGQIYDRSEIFGVPNLKAFAAKMASLPLASHPGEKYEYGVNTDVLGHVVEIVSGMTLDEFIKTRITDPLKMTDTHFTVPAAKASRVAKTYGLKQGKLEVEPPNPSLAFNEQVAWGGMGLYSTIGDYARFAQMMLNGGQLDGVRILSRKTVELMTSNHLAHLPRVADGPGEGFGLGVSVITDMAASNKLSSPGTFGWAGAASTFFRVDPKEKMIVLLFMQHFPFDAATLELFRTLAFQAIAD